MFFIAVVAVLACLPVFSGCSASVVYTLCTDEKGEKYYSVKCDGNANYLSGELVIPETYGTGDSAAPVRVIPELAFSSSKITALTVPATVKEIGASAFSYCSALKKVTFADGTAISEISRGVFGYCHALEEISIPQTVKIIDRKAFFNCYSLTSALLPDALETISDGAFSGCERLTKIDLPETLTSIGAEAFYQAGLESVVIPESVKDKTIQTTNDKGEPATEVLPGIGEAAFHSCVNLKTAVVNARISTVKSGTFGYCIALEEIYLPDCLRKVEGAYRVNGKIYYGHPFHNDGALSRVYFAGTSDEWKQVEVDKTDTTSNAVRYNNAAFIKAEVRVESKYTPTQN